MSRLRLFCFCVVLVLGGMNGQTALAAQAPSAAAASCRVALGELAGTWTAIAFPLPSKPGQAVVRGRDGHSTTGAQFFYMVGQIRQAHRECGRGDTEAAKEHIVTVRNLLAAARPANG
jgi:hypothetical protein